MTIAIKVTIIPLTNKSFTSNKPDPKAIALGGVLTGSAIDVEHIIDIAMANII